MPELHIGRLKGRFTVSWWEDGQRRRHRLKALDRKSAEREALDVYERVTFKPGDVTVETLWEKYREEKKGRRVSDAMKYEWKAVGPHFGHLRPEHIKPETCRDYISKRRTAGIKDGTIWTEMGHLRTVMAWAVKRRMIAFAPDIERPAKPAPKDRYLSRDEIETLLAAQMAPHIRLSMLLMLSTAARPTAALELTWDRVDFERRQIDLRLDAEGPRKGRAIVAMNNGLRAALQEARKVALSDHVIEWCGEPVKSIKTGFYAAVKASGLEGVTPHVLRHTAAVHLAAAGVPMSKISQLMGHSSTAITERVYARFAPDHMRDEVEILDFSNLKAAV